MGHGVCPARITSTPNKPTRPKSRASTSPILANCQRRTSSNGNGPQEPPYLKDVGPRRLVESPDHCLVTPSSMVLPAARRTRRRTLGLRSAPENIGRTGLSICPGASVPQRDPNTPRRAARLAQPTAVARQANRSRLPARATDSGGGQRSKQLLGRSHSLQTISIVASQHSRFGNALHQRRMVLQSPGVHPRAGQETLRRRLSRSAG